MDTDQKIKDLDNEYRSIMSQFREGDNIPKETSNRLKELTDQIDKLVLPCPFCGGGHFNYMVWHPDKKTNSHEIMCLESCKRSMDTPITQHWKLSDAIIYWNKDR